MFPFLGFNFNRKVPAVPGSGCGCWICVWKCFGCGSGYGLEVRNGVGFVAGGGRWISVVEFVLRDGVEFVAGDSFGFVVGEDFGFQLETILVFSRGRR